jgi:chromate transporter
MEQVKLLLCTKWDKASFSGGSCLARLTWRLPSTTATRPSLREILNAFFRISNTTFGGGFITMVILGREFVEKRGWLRPSQYDVAFSLSRVTPGTNMIAFCVATGYQLRGWYGAFLAVVAAILPSALIAVLLMQGFESWNTNPWLAAALEATVAAVAGMMWAVVWMLARPHSGGLMRNVRALVILGGAFTAAWFGVTPLPIIGAAVIVGYLWKDPTPEDDKELS